MEKHLFGFILYQYDEREFKTIKIDSLYFILTEENVIKKYEELKGHLKEKQFIIINRV